jgi:hypothetical protein
MSQKRKFQRQAGETGPETQYRLSNEAETAKVADKLKEMLGPRMAFVLIASTINASPEDKSFANTSYVSTMRREDSARLLCEMLDRWMPSGIPCEPVPATMTEIREDVFAIRDEPMKKLLAGALDDLTKCVDVAARVTARGEAATPTPDDAKEMAINALAVAVQAIAVFDQARRVLLAPGAAPPSEADLAAAELLMTLAPRPEGFVRGDTKVTLVADLEAKPPCENRDQIIAMAKQGHFHDYDSDFVAPKVALFEMLMQFGYPDLAEKCKAGAYDADKPTVEQIEEMRQEVGPAFYDAMMGEKPRGKS